MWKFITMPLVMLALTSFSAWAQSDPSTGQPGTVDDASVSVTTPSEVEKGELRNEIVGINPQIGAINFRDTFGTVAIRAIGGFTFDLNGTGIVNNIMGATGGTDLYAGATLGVLYSHPGASGSGFLGTADPDGTVAGTGAPGANLVMIPLNAKIGWNIGKFQMAAHGGGNLFYRSVASAVAVGYSANPSNSSDWTIMPNIGADFKYGATNNIGILLRPDWTMSGSNSLITATLGASIALG